MLDAQLKTQLQAYLERLRSPIELVASLDEGEASREMRELLDEIASLSMLITVEPRRRRSRRPSFVDPPRRQRRLGAFAGMPLGHEFTSLVLALLQVGGHPPKVEDEVLEQARALDGDYLFETYRLAVVPELPGRRAGAEPDERAQPARPPRRDRRRAVPGRGRGAQVMAVPACS
jgi:alkyl hydroperoxide reductase subunit F